MNDTKVWKKIKDLLDTISAVYDIRDDWNECKRGVYLDYRNWKYYIYYTTEDKKYWNNKKRFESYNPTEIKTYLTGYLDAL